MGRRVMGKRIFFLWEYFFINCGWLSSKQHSYCNQYNFDELSQNLVGERWEWTPEFLCNFWFINIFGSSLDKDCSRIASRYIHWIASDSFLIIDGELSAPPLPSLSLHECEGGFSLFTQHHYFEKLTLRFCCYNIAPHFSRSLFVGLWLCL